jgi:hypothetical protein
LFVISSIFAFLALLCLPLIRSARRAGPVRH